MQKCPGGRAIVQRRGHLDKSPFVDLFLEWIRLCRCDHDAPLGE